MNPITVRSIFISLLVAGCFTALWLRNEATEKSGAISQTDVVRLIVVDGKNYYFPTGSACGNGYINCYESIDGVQVCRSGGAYTKHARRSLEAAMSQGIVIENTPVLDDADRVLGDRVVFVYPKKDTGRQAAAICSRVGDGIACIDGDSLAHVLAFEKVFGR